MWEEMSCGDLSEINDLARLIWGKEFYESPEVFEEKYWRWPWGCFVYRDGPCVLGYAFSHPWYKMNPPRLNQKLGTTAGANTYHIHDIALLPGLRGKGLLKQVMPLIELQGKKFDSMSLVGVNNSRSIWEKYRFQTVPNLDVSQYCESAVYMIKQFD
jgi:hypothetical protein